MRRTNNPITAQSIRRWAVFVFSWFPAEVIYWYAPTRSIIIPIAPPMARMALPIFMARLLKLPILTGLSIDWPKTGTVVNNKTMPAAINRILKYKIFTIRNYEL